MSSGVTLDDDQHCSRTLLANNVRAIPHMMQHSINTGLDGSQVERTLKPIGKTAPETHLFQSDASEQIKKLIGGGWKFRLIVTSPPYFTHRLYGDNNQEIGQEMLSADYVHKMAELFTLCKDLLTEDGSLFLNISDTKINGSKSQIPYKLGEALKEQGFYLKDDIIWCKVNTPPSSMTTGFTQGYEHVLWLSKSEKTFTNIDPVRMQSVDVTRRKKPDNIQYEPVGKDSAKVAELQQMMKTGIQIDSTSTIARAFGYDPEAHCPTCWRKFKRHAVRVRKEGQRHYPMFAACNPLGKNPSNVWNIPNNSITDKQDRKSVV